MVAADAGRPWIVTQIATNVGIETRFRRRAETKKVCFLMRARVVVLDISIRPVQVPIREFNI
jgi:hypothetical protein